MDPISTIEVQIAAYEGLLEDFCTYAAIMMIRYELEPNTIELLDLHEPRVYEPGGNTRVITLTDLKGTTTVLQDL